MLDDIEDLLARIKLFGARVALNPYAPEGPRKKGHCVYCDGPCVGVTPDCDLRVWRESWTERNE